MMILLTHSVSIFKTRFTSSLFVCLLVMFVAACGKPFNVKPKPDVKDVAPNAQAILTAEGESNGLQIHAAAITDEDYLYHTFEANLILAGVLPVHMKMTNTGAENAQLKNAKLEIKAQNQSYKMLDSHKAYKRLMSFYEISIYNKHGHRESRKDFDTHAFDMKKSLAAGESREGLIYFAVPNEVIKNGNLTLSARKLSAGRVKTNEAIEFNLK
jgi:hypothetical protein